MQPRIIVIDGKTYNNVSEMPHEVRKRYEQALRALEDMDRNRVPDALENNNLSGDKDRDSIPDLIENSGGAPIVVSSVKVLVDGKEYNSLDDLPPEARAKYNQAMGALDSNRNGMPDFMEGMTNGQQASAPAGIPLPNDTSLHNRPAPNPVPSIATPDTTGGWTIALAILLLLFICAAMAAGVWYFFLR